jgi:hypothetical protein
LIKTPEFFSNETETIMNLENTLQKVLTLFTPTIFFAFHVDAGTAEDIERYGFPTTYKEKGLCIATAGQNEKYLVQTTETNGNIKATVYLITNMGRGRTPGTVIMFRAARMAIDEVKPRVEGNGWVIEGPNILSFRNEEIRNSAPKYVKIKIIPTNPMSGLINNSIPIRCNP